MLTLLIGPDVQFIQLARQQILNMSKDSARLKLSTTTTADPFPGCEKQRKILAWG